MWSGTWVGDEQERSNFRSYLWRRGFQYSRQEIVNGALGMLYPSPIWKTLSQILYTNDFHFLAMIMVWLHKMWRLQPAFSVSCQLNLISQQKNNQALAFCGW
jgi:hypothetical protein